MNRPNMKDDPNYPFEFSDTYLHELEKYCDELEHALDKACAMLSEFDRFCKIDEYIFNEEAWKAWCFKDE